MKQKNQKRRQAAIKRWKDGAYNDPVGKAKREQAIKDWSKGDASERGEEWLNNMTESVRNAIAIPCTIFGKEFPSLRNATIELGVGKGMLNKIKETGARTIFEHVEGWNKAHATRTINKWMASRGPELIPASISLDTEDIEVFYEAVVPSDKETSYNRHLNDPQDHYKTTYKNVEDHFSGVDLHCILKRIKEVDVVTIKLLLDQNYFLSNKTRAKYYEKVNLKLMQEKMNWLKNL